MILRMRAVLLRVLVLVPVLVGLGASPAAADPVESSDFRSEVTDITPAVGGVRAEIRGGDTFLELSVEPGHEVIVYSYEPNRARPYLRFLKDGRVQRNKNASATYINESRRGGGTIPTSLEDPSADTPVWQDVADGGRYAWHDHRVHWMAEVDPPVARGERVGGAYDPWVVPIEVDGRVAEVRGTLLFEDSISPVPWVLLAIVVAGLVAVVGRRSTLLPGSVALIIASGLAIVTGLGELRATPGSGGNASLWALPAAALYFAVVALIRHRALIGVVSALVSVASLSGWALLRRSVLLKPVLPSELSASFDRASVAVAIGVAVAAAYLAVTSGAWKLPELADDDERSPVEL